MNEKTDVTLIAPCYNCEDCLERFLNSVLYQTIDGFQFILVDDGSTDNSNIIIKKYQQDLQVKCDFLYIRKENGGAASAVNVALKFVDRKYLMWADCDDELAENNILLKLSFLENNLNYDYVVCSARVIDNCTQEQIRLATYSDTEKTMHLFEKLLFGGIKCFPGVFMIKTESLFNVIGDTKEIYCDREVGQNWQLLLPVAYSGKCGYIDDVLYNYYVRASSHSHNTNYEKEMSRTYHQEQVLYNTLKFLDETKYDQYKHAIYKHYQKKRMEIAFNEGDKQCFVSCYLQYKRNNAKVEMYLRKQYAIMKYNRLYILYSHLKKVMR